jgi:elongator complex protein 3
MGSEGERMKHACMLICQRLIEALKKGDTAIINLNALKAKVAHDLKLANMPKLVDILAAVPEAYKKDLLPFLRGTP